MRVGIHLPHIGRKAGPEAIRRAAVQAEALGFADAWVSEHIIVPKGAAYPPSALFYDPVLTLTWAAACTHRIGLGTSVLVLPMRHPLPLAKELATLQNLSGGRLILGAGVGWMAAEFAALGAPFGERGRRMDEGIALMRAVWSDDPVTFPTRHIPAVVEDYGDCGDTEITVTVGITGDYGDYGDSALYCNYAGITVTVHFIVITVHFIDSPCAAGDVTVEVKCTVTVTP